MVKEEVQEQVWLQGRCQGSGRGSRSDKYNRESQMEWFLLKVENGGKGEDVLMVGFHCS